MFDHDQSQHQSHKHFYFVETGGENHRVIIFYDLQIHDQPPESLSHTYLHLLRAIISRQFVEPRGYNGTITAD